MKVFGILFLIVLLSGVFVYSCGGSETSVKSDSADTRGGIVSGEQLYMDNCVVCHGQDGTAGMTGATDLSKSVLSHTNTVDVITNGRNTMRAFGSQFSKEEIEALAKHVESLRK